MPSMLKSCRVCRRTFAGGETFCPEDGSRLFVHTAGVDLAPDPLIGATLDGRYKVLRLLGEGGMGRVYEGEHVLIERRVAIKVLREDFTRRADVVERFRREAKSASRIGHPNIVDVIDFGEAPGGASYFVMELLQGEDLADVLARCGKLPASRAVLIAFQCCHALAAAHDKGVVHRDMKPENVFLLEREGAADFVKLVDFGVAKMSELDAVQKDGGKLTRSGVIFGTPEYMSPEQAAGHAPDHRADIYALGITLYELLTGRVPFEGASFMSVLTKHANKPLPPLRELNPDVDVSPELEAVVLRALHKDREARFQSMREMAQALEAVPEMPPLPFRLTAPSQPRSASTPELTSAAPVEGAARRPTRSFDRRVLWLSVAALTAVSAVAIAVGFDGSDEPSTAVSTGAAASGGTAVHDRRTSTAPTAPPSAPPAASQAVEATGELSLVPVKVTTDPAGASVRVVGGAEVCASTPCSFEVVAGRPVALLARRGRSQAMTAVTPAGATELHLVLDVVAAAKGAAEAAASAPSFTSTSAPAPKREAVTAKTARAKPVTAPDDLKVPDMYR
jgi:serine/threonine protein kinase